MSSFVNIQKNYYPKLVISLFLSMIVGIGLSVYSITALASSLGGGTWATKSSMHYLRLAPGAATYNDKIYVLGGMSTWDVAVRIFEEYDPLTDTWTDKGEMPNARWHPGVIAVNDKIYAIGGYYGGGSYAAEVHEYDPVTNTWRSLTAMPVQRVNPAVAAVNGKIYAFGGSACCGATSTVYEYDVSADSWMQKTDMIHARHLHTGVALNGKVYAIGGYDQTGTVYSSVEEYDPATNTWRLIAPMSVARMAPAAAVINGKIYVMGGSGNAEGTQSLSSVEEYDSISDTWRTVTAMPTARLAHTAAVANNKIYAIGGYYPDNFLSITEEYTPPAYTFEGFYAPVNNLPALNSKKAGQAIPLKWRITDDDNNPVTDLSNVKVTVSSLTCPLGVTPDQIEEQSSGNSGLQNLGDGYYQWNWKTSKQYANSCKTLNLDLGDGVQHKANFQFTK